MLRKSVKIVGAVLLVTLVLLVAVGGIARHLYYAPRAADLPCRGCDGQARAVSVNGFDLYYRELGSRSGGAPIVLLHGGPGQSSQTFKHGFDFLATDYRVIFYDQRGSGNSQIRPEVDLYSMDLLVQDLETLRQEVIQADTITLIAHSAGGALALRYAILYPQHVDRIVLVSALPPNGGQAVGGVLMESVVATMNVLAGNLPPADPLAANEQFNQVTFETNMLRLYDPRRTDLLEDMGYISLAVSHSVERSTWGGNFDAQLARLTCLVLIVYGQADNSYTGESTARYLADVLPDATLARMEHSGHWPYLEEPEEFQAALLAFLSK